jgi:hypothetical protein
VNVLRDTSASTSTISPSANSRTTGGSTSRIPTTADAPGDDLEGDERDLSSVTRVTQPEAVAAARCPAVMCRRKGPCVVLALLAFALASVAIAAGAVKQRSATTLSARVELGPPVVGLGQRSSIVVSNVRVPSLQVLLMGAADQFGKPLGWRSLRSVGGSWRGTLPTPAFLGIYPVVLRVRVGATPFGSAQWLLRVFAPGTRVQPSFDDPVDVARWWVQTMPRETLVAVKAWPFPAFDRRDPRLHRLFVVAYAPAIDPSVDDQLGMFITAVRDGYEGRWRFLEATLEP